MATIQTTIGQRIVKEIDKGIAERQSDGHRGHLGMSGIGKGCPRQIWYSWRWFYKKFHTGRLLRLFQRGHDEEARIISWLRSIGAVVEERDPITGEQWNFKDFWDHYGGSCDGKIWGLERFGLEGKGVCEFKTHNDKSFKDVKAKGVLSSKPEHYGQMQEYMHYSGSTWALYVAINKNDDELYIEVVHYKAEVAEMLRDKAGQIISALRPPLRTSKDPTFYICKMCDYHEICHHHHKPHKNCRTCVFSLPIEGGRWYCDKWKDVIPDHVLRAGCDTWEPITDETP
jgi:hypothetical protein